MQISLGSTCVGVFFNKVAGPRNSSFIKKRLQQRFFFCEVCQLSNNIYFVEDLSAVSETSVRLFKNTYIIYKTFPVAASDSFRFPACNFNKKKTPVNMFICEFCKIFENIFRQKHHLLLVSICEFWEVFQITSFIKHVCLFHLQVAEFQPSHTVKMYFTCAFQAFYSRRRRSYSEAFMYLKFLKVICEEVNLLWSCQKPTSKLTKKSLWYMVLQAYCLNFLRIHHNYFFMITTYLSRESTRRD